MHRVSWILSEIFTLTLGIILTILHVFLFVVCFPIFAYRYVLCKSSKFLNPKLGNMITARGQFLASENFTGRRAPRAMVVVSLIVKGRQDIEEIRRRVNLKWLNARSPENENELKYPELTQYVTPWPSWFGFQFWKPEENFDIEDHVKLYQPHSPFKDEDLRNLIENLVNDPFQPGKSPWEMFVTNNFMDPNISPDEMTIITHKAHHCLSDGFGWLYAIIEDLGGGVLDVPRASYARRTWTLKQFLYQLTFPFRCIYELSKFAIMTVQRHHWKVPDDKKAWKQLYRNSSIIPVYKIKAIKKRFGVSFATVIQSVFAGASRKSLLGTSTNSGDNNELINIGSLPSAIILPLPNHPKRLINHCTGIYVNLPVELSDPVARLRECERRLLSARDSPRGFLGTVLPIITGSFTTGLASIVGVNRQLPLGISNFPVSTSSQYRFADTDLLQLQLALGVRLELQE